MNTVEQDYITLMSKLQSGENFTYNRINDCEMRAIRGWIGGVASRGKQVISHPLTNKLREAIKFRKDNYWFGRVCKTCRKRDRAEFDKRVEKSYPNVVSSTLFCHNNMWPRFISDFNNVAKEREIVWISGNDQNLDDLEFNVERFIEVPRVDAWSKYQEILPLVSEFNSDCIVSLSCGPMSRVLAYEWTKIRDDCTYFIMGAYYDPYTRNRWNRSQRGTAPYCSECNLTGVRK